MSKPWLQAVRSVREFFYVTEGETPSDIIVAFRGSTDAANSGTVGIRTLSIEEAECMVFELNTAIMVGRAYRDGERGHGQER